ncbi:MAG: hypothetical protein IBV52_08430 [Candidatus Bathyarchaeota archaeon]
MNIKERILREIIKNANKQQRKIVNLMLDVNEGKITKKELDEQCKAIPILTKDVEIFNELRRDTSINIIINEIEELKKRVAKIE